MISTELFSNVVVSAALFLVKGLMPVSFLSGGPPKPYQCPKLLDKFQKLSGWLGLHNLRLWKFPNKVSLWELQHKLSLWKLQHKLSLWELHHKLSLWELPHKLSLWEFCHKLSLWESSQNNDHPT